jgi:hypothetical protein
MKDILEKLKQYFKDTPREEVLKGWKQVKENTPKSDVEFMNLEIAPQLKKFLEGNEYYMGLSSSGKMSMIPKEYFGEKE